VVPYRMIGRFPLAVQSFPELIKANVSGTLTSWGWKSREEYVNIIKNY